MQTLQGMTYFESKQYRNAYSRGYFVGYDDDPKAWRNTFAGVYVLKYPGRISVLDEMTNLVGHIPTWEDLTDENLREFVNVICEKYAANSAHTFFAELKAVLNDFADEKPIASKRFNKILKVKREQSQAVYLTLDELKKIIDYQPQSNYERYVKKIFIIEALTGARNCDSKRLSIANCDDNLRTITYFSQKTHKSVTLPIWNDVLQFLSDPIDTSISLVYFNRLLREICRRCKIDENVSIYTRGKLTTGPKWQFVSSHTGRRSYATNLYILHVEPSTIAQFMGHSSPEITIRRYILGYREVTPDMMTIFNKPIEYGGQY